MEAERPLATTPKRIAYIADNTWACAWYRCHAPGMELLRRGHDVTLHEEIRTLAREKPDVLIVQAMVHPDLFRIATQLQSEGTLLVYDQDDEPFSLHPENPGYGFWNAPDVQEMVARFLRAADIVTTTTPELADSFRRFNRQVVVLPNMLPSEHWPRERRPVVERQPLVVGWAGSSSHAPDLREIEDLLLQTLERFEQVEVHLAGAREHWLRRTHPRLKLLAPVVIEEYAGLLDGFDIALAPLANNKFNRGKSDLKAVEYGMIGLPVIASKMPSYERLIRQGENGFLAVTQKDWLQRLSALIQDCVLRDRLGSALHAQARQRIIELNIGAWEKVYGINY